MKVTCVCVCGYLLDNQLPVSIRLSNYPTRGNRWNILHTLTHFSHNLLLILLKYLVYKLRYSNDEVVRVLNITGKMPKQLSN